MKIYRLPKVIKIVKAKKSIIFIVEKNELFNQGSYATVCYQEDDEDIETVIGLGYVETINNKGYLQIKIEKKELAGEAYKGGNVSDLGGYYNELVYFCEKAKKGEKVEKATLCNGVSSLDFLLKELAFNA